MIIEYSSSAISINDFAHLTAFLFGDNTIVVNIVHFLDLTAFVNIFLKIGG